MQEEPTIAGPTINVDIPGVNICCHKLMEQLVDAVTAAVLHAAEAHGRDHAGRPLPMVRLHMRAPQLLFALLPDRCAHSEPSSSTGVIDQWLNVPCHAAAHIGVPNGSDLCAWSQTLLASSVTRTAPLQVHMSLVVFGPLLGSEALTGCVVVAGTTCP